METPKFRLLPIKPGITENPEFSEIEDCRETLGMSIEYYKVISYYPPWIGYFAESEGRLVGSAGFKGQPVDNKIEISYGTFPAFRNRGIGGLICREMVRMAQAALADVVITARTLPGENYSTRILRKNGFYCAGVVWDDDDGEVWEWFYGQISP